MIFYCLNSLMIGLAVSKVILESPRSVTVNQGSPATLNCRTNSSVDGIIWYKDGSVVGTEEYQDKILILPDGSLFFLTTEVTDTGNYHCNAVTWEGVEESKTATLKVTNVKNSGHEMSNIFNKVEDTIETVSRKNALSAKMVNVDHEDGDSENRIDGNTQKVRLSSFPKIYKLHKKENSSISDSIKIEVNILRAKEKTKSKSSLTLWILSILVVISMTILTILGVTILTLKIRNLNHMGSIQVEENVYEKPVFVSKKLSDMYIPWKCPIPATNSRLHCEHLIHEPSDREYDNASSQQYFMSNLSSDSEQSNHYASADIRSLPKRDIMSRK